MFRVLAGPLLGAAIACFALLPSMPALNEPRPLLAFGGLVVGIALAAVITAVGRLGVVLAVLAVLVVVAVGISRSGVSESLDVTGDRLSASRLEIGSPPRARLHENAVDLFARNPIAGVGPGNFVRESRAHGRLQVKEYVHDEYVQLLAEQGAIGAALALVLMFAVARLLWKGRVDGPSQALWAGCVAAFAAVAVHAGFDFVWHIPVVLLCLAFLLGLTVKPAASMSEVGLKERGDE